MHRAPRIAVVCSIPLGRGLYLYTIVLSQHIAPWEQWGQSNYSSKDCFIVSFLSICLFSSLTSTLFYPLIAVSIHSTDFLFIVKRLFLLRSKVSSWLSLRRLSENCWCSQQFTFLPPPAIFRNSQRLRSSSQWKNISIFSVRASNQFSRTPEEFNPAAHNVKGNIVCQELLIFS